MDSIGFSSVAERTVNGCAVEVCIPVGAALVRMSLSTSEVSAVEVGTSRMAVTSRPRHLLRACWKCGFEEGTSRVAVRPDLAPLGC